jgi:hypothetical protein
MTDAPETIWAMASMDGKWSDGHCTNVQPQVNDITAPFIFEYTRTDISQARIAELELALDGLLEIADPAWNPIAFSNARAALKPKP